MREGTMKTRIRRGFRPVATILIILGVGAVTAAGTYAARSSGHDHSKHVKVAMRDDCDPRDPAWPAPSGGCQREKGNVTFAEFNAALNSPHSPTTVVGHQSWRNDPSYLVVREGTSLKVRNTGGRSHSFTKVANFGGGITPPPINKGLAQAPECPFAIGVLPGGSITIPTADLPVGDHLFQCCFHPWMRAQVTVLPKASGHDDDDDDHDHHAHH